MDIQNHREEMLAALPPDILNRGVAALRKLWEGDTSLRQEIRNGWNEDPDTWWAPIHHGWGTHIRNYLRNEVCTDEHLPSLNWDDYYIALVEISCDLRKMPVVPHPLREELASYAHSAWAGWMQYMFSKSAVTMSGNVIIPSELFARWTRQMDTPYADLPESEKESDRAEADKMLKIFSTSAK